MVYKLTSENVADFEVFWVEAVLADVGVGGGPAAQPPEHDDAHQT